MLWFARRKTDVDNVNLSRKERMSNRFTALYGLHNLGVILQYIELSAPHPENPQNYNDAK